MATTPNDHKAYYPGATPIDIRVTGDRNSGHPGAEISKRVDTYATALFHDMTIDEVSDLDLADSPLLGSPWDAVQAVTQTWIPQRGQ